MSIKALLDAKNKTQEACFFLKGKFTYKKNTKKKGLPIA